MLFTDCVLRLAEMDSRCRAYRTLTARRESLCEEKCKEEHVDENPGFTKR
jgi:hypothetical protein